MIGSYKHRSCLAPIWLVRSTICNQWDLRNLVLRVFVRRLPRAAFMHGQPVHVFPPPTHPTYPTWFFYPCPPSYPTLSSVCPIVVCQSVCPTPPPTRTLLFVILPLTRRKTTPELMSTYPRRHIISLGFGRVVTSVDAVIVARHGGRCCASRSETCNLRGKVHFVTEEVPYDLGDEEAPISDLEVCAGVVFWEWTKTIQHSLFGRENNQHVWRLLDITFSRIFGANSCRCTKIAMCLRYD